MPHKEILQALEQPKKYKGFLQRQIGLDLSGRSDEKIDEIRERYAARYEPWTDLPKNKPEKYMRTFGRLAVPISGAVPAHILEKAMSIPAGGLLVGGARLMKHASKTRAMKDAARFGGKGIDIAIDASADIIESIAKKPVQIAKLGGAAKKGSLDAASFIGELLTSIPKEFYKRALRAQIKGQPLWHVLQQKNVFGKLGRKIIDGTNKVMDDLGIEVGKGVKRLRKSKKVVDSRPFTQMIDDHIKFRRSPGDATKQALSDKALNDLATIKRLLKPPTPKTPPTGGFKVDTFTGMRIPVLPPPPLKPEVPIYDYQIVVNKIDQMVKWSMDPAQQLDDATSTLLKKIRYKANQMIKKADPALGKANDAFSNFKEYMEALSGVPSGKMTKQRAVRVARRVTDLQDIGTKRLGITQAEAMDLIDDMMPKQYKFMKDVKDAQAAFQFAPLYPGKGGGFGSKEGGGQMIKLGLWAYILSTLKGPAGAVAKTTFLPLISPKAHSKLMPLAVKGHQKFGGPVSRYLGRQATKGTRPMRDIRFVSQELKRIQED